MTVSIAPSDRAWLSSIRDDIAAFMARLRVPGHAGRYRPCPDGTALAGEQAALGFSCFALKIAYTLGLWQRLSEAEQDGWLAFIRAYQVLDPASAHHSAFVDPHLIAGVAPLPPEGLRERARRWLAGHARPDPQRDAIRAETKQAIATLAQVGAAPRLPYGGFQQDETALLQRLNELDWRNPWSAGAQTAGLAVFIRSQGPLLDGVDAAALIETTARFLDGVADPETGAYFRGGPPQRGRLINGAMKVLNALDWLEAPIHHPERLIDTALQQGPPPAGCHVVDWVYVVHRCGLQTGHRKPEIQARCLEVLQTIKGHQHRQDRGFSYQPGRAQNGYYGATISRGLDEGDIHGTCLLVWALSLIADILEEDGLGWHIIRP